MAVFDKSKAVRKILPSPLRQRLRALILLAAVPSAASIIFFGFKDYEASIHQNAMYSARITHELVLTQQTLISETLSFLQKLAVDETVQDPSDPACSVFLSHILQLSDRYQNLGIPGANGDLLCTAIPLAQPVNVADRPYIRKALDQGVFSVGSFQSDRAAEVISVNFAYPVIPDGQREPVGAVVAVLGLEWWSKQLMRLELPDGTKAAITDREGKIIAIHPSDETALGKELASQAAFSNPPVTGPEGEMVQGDDGIRRVMSRSILFQDGEGQPIEVSLAFPVEQVLVEARQSVLIRLAVLGSLLVLFSSLALRILEGQVIRPLGALNQAILGFEKGQIEDHILEAQTSKVSDFEQISSSFRRMSRARLAAETSERERLQQLQALLDALPDSYFRLNRDGVILEYSATEAADLLMPPEQFVGRRAADVLPAPALKLFDENMKRYHETGRAVSWEYELEINGHRVDFEARVRPIGDGDEMVLVARNISELKRAREKILLQARTDFLTRLPNRASLTAELDAAVDDANRNDQQLVLLFVDLDGLKQINDRLGHATGDGLLKLVSQRLRGCLGPRDFAARHAGDEFVLLLRGDDPAARARAATLRVLAAMQRPFVVGAETVHISASIGSAICPQDAKTPQALLSAADQAMYSAKSSGGGRIHLFTPEIGLRNANRIRLMDDLHAGLIKDEFELHYQPIVDLKSGRVVLAEALLRWNHPELGQLAPDRFLPLAEEGGLMVQLGDAGLQRACNDLPALRNRFGEGFQICVNHSPSELSAREHGKGLDWASYIKANTPSDASIMVEITEAALLDPTPFTLSSLRSFHDAGIEIALDDFGAGYSSLLYFLNNEFDYLKIDREFAQSAPESQRAIALCETILGLSNRLGSRAIAEGIERKSQLRFFQNRNCALGQGFLFSKGLSRRQLLEFTQVVDIK